jgi:hypothetical protein
MPTNITFQLYYYGTVLKKSDAIYVEKFFDQTKIINAYYWDHIFIFEEKKFKDLAHILMKRFGVGDYVYECEEIYFYINAKKEWLKVNFEWEVKIPETIPCIFHFMLKINDEYHLFGQEFFKEVSQNKCCAIM